MVYGFSNYNNYGNPYANMGQYPMGGYDPYSSMTNPYMLTGYNSMPMNDMFMMNGSMSGYNGQMQFSHNSEDEVVKNTAIVGTILAAGAAIITKGKTGKFFGKEFVKNLNPLRWIKSVPEALKSVAGRNAKVATKEFIEHNGIKKQLFRDKNNNILKTIAESKDAAGNTLRVTTDASGKVLNKVKYSADKSKIEILDGKDKVLKTIEKELDANGKVSKISTKEGKKTVRTVERDLDANGKFKEIKITDGKNIVKTFSRGNSNGQDVILMTGPNGNIIRTYPEGGANPTP